MNPEPRKPIGYVNRAWIEYHGEEVIKGDVIMYPESAPHYGYYMTVVLARRCDNNTVYTRDAWSRLVDKFHGTLIYDRSEQ